MTLTKYKALPSRQPNDAVSKVPESLMLVKTAKGVDLQKKIEGTPPLSVFFPLPLKVGP